MVWRTNKKGQHYQPKNSGVKGVDSSVFPEGITEHHFKKRDDIDELELMGNPEELEEFAREKAESINESESRQILYAKKQAQVDAINNAIKQWNDRRQEIINGEYGDPNSPELIKKFTYANSQIKFLKKERDNIIGQMVLLE